jgi:hypothetical protein
MRVAALVPNPVVFLCGKLSDLFALQQLIMCVLYKYHVRCSFSLN